MRFQSLSIGLLGQNEPFLVSGFKRVVKGVWAMSSPSTNPSNFLPKDEDEIQAMGGFNQSGKRKEGHGEKLINDMRALFVISPMYK